MMDSEKTQVCRSVSITCSMCQKQFQAIVEKTQAEKVVTCPGCGTKIHAKFDPPESDDSAG